MRSSICFLLSLMFVVLVATGEPARFVLTFDDGPSTRKQGNPTAQILDVLTNNQIQTDIKAIFFTQSVINSTADGIITEQLLNREFQANHILGIHSGVLKRHSKHTQLDAEEMAQFLLDSKAVLKSITGQQPDLVRPTFWAFNDATLKSYADFGLSMLLTDINVYDGKSWGYRANLRRKNVLEKQMQHLNKRINNKTMTAVDGWLPIIVTFHDTNSWTADHMEEYLGLLIETATSAGIELAPDAFYSDYNQLLKAAKYRTTYQHNWYEYVPTRWRRLWHIFIQQSI